MAIRSGIRRHCHRNRRAGKMLAAGGAVMEPRGGRALKAGGRGIRGCKGGQSLGQVVKAGSTDSGLDKASSAGSAEESWIYVRGHRLKKAGLHIDPHGNVYVPDSEDEESGMEVAMDLNLQVHDEAVVGAAGVQMAADMAEDKVAHNDLPVHDRLLLAADEDSRRKVPIEVPEQLKEVLANIDPVYHEVFVSMYKIMVPICFR